MTSIKRPEADASNVQPACRFCHEPMVLGTGYQRYDGLWEHPGCLCENFAAMILQTSFRCWFLDAVAILASIPSSAPRMKAVILPDDPPDSLLLGIIAENLPHARKDTELPPDTLRRKLEKLETLRQRMTDALPN